MVAKFPSSINEDQKTGQDYSRRSLFLRLSFFFATSFMLLGIHVPFWPVWLKDRGFNADDVGMMLFAVSLGRMVSAPLLGMLADRSGARRGLLIATAILILPVTWMHGQIFSVEGQTAMHLVAGFILAAFVPLGDNLALMAEKRHGVDYARARAWGSKGFILTSLGTGLILTGRDSDLILYVLMGSIILLILAAFTLPRIEEKPAIKNNPDRKRSRDIIKELFRDRIFLTGILTSGLLQASHGALYGFGSLHWRAAGHSETIIGLLWTEGVIVEILLFYVAGRWLGKVSPVTLLLVGAVGGLMRWPGLAMLDDLPSLLLLQAMHAMTFAATHLGAMKFLRDHVPDTHSATAQSLHAALVGGVFMGGSLWGAGQLYAQFGGAAFFAMAGLSLAGMIMALIVYRLQKPTNITIPE